MSFADRFAATLGVHGWALWDHAHFEKSQEALAHAENGDPAAAERLLAGLVDEKDDVDFHIQRMRVLGAFKPRERLVRLACADHLEGRYHASIPVLLAQLDGLHRDVTGRDLFDRGKLKRRTTSYNTLAGDPSAVAAITEMAVEGAKETTSAPAHTPSRHGVLHGRELAHDTRFVSAKCLTLFFAMRAIWLEIKTTVNDLSEHSRERRTR